MKTIKTQLGKLKQGDLFLHPFSDNSRCICMMSNQDLLDPHMEFMIVRGTLHPQYNKSEKGKTEHIHSTEVSRRIPVQKIV